VQYLNIYNTVRQSISLQLSSNCNLTGSYIGNAVTTLAANPFLNSPAQTSSIVWIILASCVVLGALILLGLILCNKKKDKTTEEVVYSEPERNLI
jgi:hypothetical protein